MAERAYRTEMKPPAGKTCTNCKHLRRCLSLGFTLPDYQYCDFYPSRFAFYHPRSEEGGK